MLDWLGNHWFEVVQTIGIVAGLFYAALAFRTGTQIQRVTNLFALTQRHFEIWSSFLEDRDLQRVLERNPAIQTAPITEKERMFVVFILLNLNCTYHARRIRGLVSLEGLDRDLQNFLCLPIPQAVWSEQKKYYNKDFVKFVEHTTGR